MVVFPNAKINLGLNITRKRDDGFHEIESIFLPVDICDILEFVETDKTSFESTGIEIPGEPMDNLCVKAWMILHETYKIPPVKIHLHKKIPIGAGLGGGSADCAFMFKALNDHFQLSIPGIQLEEYSAKLGSDCPFFIKNKPAWVTGRGEKLSPIDIDLSNYKILLVNPNIHVSTKEAYSGIVPQKPMKSILDFVANSVDTWQNEVVNDFEVSVFNKYPAIEKIKNQMLEIGAKYASMSGSGSSVYGIFDKDVIPSMEIFNDFSVFECQATKS
ncbi:MAG: 4-(cytidine 5'-diphospho)-2-C-methyl-D-erythritol kinase [Bacteroidales bacterium]|nr:4-(cytidine 5'-diphospho)-2-C-methyl-D-erythritol kinase [Bacteroidales bacterium]